MHLTRRFNSKVFLLAFKYIGVDIPELDDLNFYVKMGEKKVYISKDAWSPKPRERVFLERKSSWHGRLQRR
jgi:hypothetical protein